MKGTELEVQALAPSERNECLASLTMLGLSFPANQNVRQSKMAVPNRVDRKKKRLVERGSATVHNLWHACLPREKESACQKCSLWPEGRSCVLASPHFVGTVSPPAWLLHNKLHLWSSAEGSKTVLSLWKTALLMIFCCYCVLFSCFWPQREKGILAEGKMKDVENHVEIFKN